MTGAVQLAGTVPGPVWSHLVRACLQHQSALPAAVMAQFGAFIPGIKVIKCTTRDTQFIRKVCIEVSIFLGLGKFNYNNLANY